MTSSTQSLSQISAILDNYGADVCLMRHIFGSKTPWSCSIELKADGTSVKVQKFGVDLESTLREAFYAVMKVAKQGIPLAQLAAPVPAEKNVDLPF